MPKWRLVFDGDNLYTEKDARIYKLKSSVSSKIDAIPWVVDSLDSTSATDALSANMGRTLQDQINAVSWIGKFLSTWNCTTWLPSTNPQEDPYTYKVWDYYVVSAVWATNYKPHWGTFTQWVPSTTVETEAVWVNDKYYFDWADWVRIPDTSIQISIDTALSTSSTNAVENRAIANAINTKQNVISDLSDIRSWASAWATAVQPWANISTLTNNLWYQTAWDVASAVSSAVGSAVSDTAYAASWNWVTTIAPSKNAVYDKINAMDTTISGISTTVSGKADANDLNTKTFPISWTWSSAAVLAEAQAAYDWYAAGKNAILSYNGDTYIFYNSITGEIYFKSQSNTKYIGLSYSYTQYKSLMLRFNNWTVTKVESNESALSPYVLETTQNYSTPYTPLYNWSPATKKYVDDSLSASISSWTTQPSNPTTWQLWYDTTNNVLKVYNWTSRNIVGDDSAEINTKTFYLPSSSKAVYWDIMQEILDWYLAWKNPIIVFKTGLNARTYIFNSGSTTYIEFWSTERTFKQNGSDTKPTQKNLLITFDWTTVTWCSEWESGYWGYLSVDIDYNTPYTPLYDWSPATKKYVDDMVGDIETLLANL